MPRMLLAVAPILALLAVVCCARANLLPTGPGPDEVFIQGGPCTISWSVDQTGAWKYVDIELMTGDNLHMVPLTVVARGLDGTNPRKNTFSYTCPQVSPHAPIYFYQFSEPSVGNKTWTGRFTITDSVDNVEAPTEPTQPSGEEIPWGVGSLVGGWSGAAPAGGGGGGGGGGHPGTRASFAPSIPTPAHPSSPCPSKTSNPQSSGVYATLDASGTPSSVPTGANGAVAVTLSAPDHVFQIALALGLAGITMML